jgi:hypothetical protein
MASNRDPSVDATREGAAPSVPSTPAVSAETPVGGQARSPEGSSQASTAAARGKEVAGHGRSEAEDAAEHAAEQAQRVADTARSEVRDVVDEARDVAREHADRQARAAGDALGTLRDDLRAMSGGGRPSDTTAEYLQRASRSLDEVAGRLERDGIEGALSGVRRFARQSPGSFLLASAGAGFAVGRLLRNADHPQQIDEGAGAEREIGRSDDRAAAAGRRAEDEFAGGERR